MLRLFVGLSPPEDICAQAQHLCSGLPHARWVAPENMHVTLRFIGEVDEGTAEDLHIALSAITAPSFSMSLNGVGTFENRRGVHAVCIFERGQLFYN